MGEDTAIFSFVNSKKQTYYLNGKVVTLKNGRTQQIYFFSRDIRPTGLTEVPEGLEVFETKATHMPVLKKSI